MIRYQRALYLNFHLKVFVGHIDFLVYLSPYFLPVSGWLLSIQNFKFCHGNYFCCCC